MTPHSDPPFGPSTPSGWSPGPPAPKNVDSARFAQAVAEHHEMEFHLRESDEHDTWSATAEGAIGGNYFALGAHGAETPDDAGENLLLALRAILEEHADVCDVCLGSQVVPGDYVGHLAGCGDCLGGIDDGEPPLTPAERAHEARRLAA